MGIKQAGSTQHGRSYGVASCAVFAITLLIFLATSTLFDPYLGSFSLDTQRWIGVVILVLPPVIGAVLGLIGVRQRAGSKALAVSGLCLNTLIALFFALVLFFAG